MDPVSRADLVCLYLAGLGGETNGGEPGGAELSPDSGSGTGLREGDGPVGHPGREPYGRSTAGVADALSGGGDTVADRIAVFSALRQLEDEGLVETAERRVEGYSGERTVHFLTPAGRERAARLRERLADETVKVRRAGTEEVPLSAMDDYFGERPLVEALVRVTDDGVIDLERGVEGAFVDREAELDLLTDRLSTVATRGGRTVLVSGPPGVGKSELVAEAADRADDHGFDVLVGRPASGGTDPYGPFRRALADLPDGEGIVERLADPDGPPVDDDEDLESERTALLYDVAAAIRDRATEKPLVLVVEDLRRADRASLDLFAYLAEKVAEWLPPVLLVGVHRPATSGPFAETVEDLRGTDRVESLLVDPLDESDTRDLVAGVVDRPDVPREFVAAVYGRTGGNPLFVVESVSRLVETGAVDPETGRFPADAVGEALPAGIDDVVEAGLAALDDDARHLVRVGSVVGDRIPLSVLERVADLPPARVRDYADLLVESRMWTREEGDLAFATGVVRDAVYEGVDPDRRRDLHRSVAAALEAVHDDADPHRARIADHYRRAGDREAALDAYEAAAEHAERTYAYGDAVDRYRAALDLVEDDERAAELHWRAGEAHRLLGEYGAAVESFEAARERTADPTGVARAVEGLGSVLVNQGRQERAREVVEEGLAAVASRDDVESREWQAKLLLREGWSYLQAGDLDAARSSMERSASIARSIDAPDVQARAAHDQATVEARSGDFGAAEERLEWAIDLYDRAEDRLGRAKATSNLAIVHWRRGDPDEALALLREVKEAFDDLGVTAGRERLLTNMGIVAKSRGDLEAAIDHYEAGLETARRLENRESIAGLHTNLGGTLEERGRLDEARERHERSRALAEDLDNPRRVAVATVNLGWIDHHEGDYGSARERAREATDLLEGTGNVTGETSADRLRGAAHREAGDHEAAVEAHRRVLERAEEADDRSEVCTVHRHLGWDHLAAGDPDRALEHARAAADEDVDAVGDRIRTRAVLAASLRATGDPDAAREHAREALDAAREHGFRLAECDLLEELARIERDADDPGAARDYAREASDLAEAVGRTPVVEACEDLLTGLSEG